MKATGKIAATAVLTMALSLAAGPAQAAGGESDDSPAAAFDLLVMKPIMLVRTAIGAGLFVIASPFAMANGTVEETAHELMVAPAEKLLAPIGHTMDDEAAHD